jgi:integrase/recombinase XerD
VLAIPNQRQRCALVGFLTRPEIEALLAAQNQSQLDWPFLASVEDGD